MDEEVDIKLRDPDDTFWIGFHSIHVDNDALYALLINFLLEAIDSRKRARIIVHEDRVVVGGVWSPQEAVQVALRLRISIGGNFEDPLLIRGVLRPLQYLGLIQ